MARIPVRSSARVALPPEGEMRPRARSDAFPAPEIRDLYTDIWSRGDPQAGFRVDAGLLSVAGHRAIVLHGLTRPPGADVDIELTTSPAWLAHNQVVNRLPAALALLHIIDAGSRGAEEE